MTFPLPPVGINADGRLTFATKEELEAELKRVNGQVEFLHSRGVDFEEPAFMSVKTRRCIAFALLLVAIFIFGSGSVKLTNFYLFVIATLAIQREFRE